MQLVLLLLLQFLRISKCGKRKNSRAPFRSFNYKLNRYLRNFRLERSILQELLLQHKEHPSRSRLDQLINLKILCFYTAVRRQVEKQSRLAFERRASDLHKYGRLGTNSCCLLLSQCIHRLGSSQFYFRPFNYRCKMSVALDFLP